MEKDYSTHNKTILLSLSEDQRAIFRETQLNCVKIIANFHSSEKERDEARKKINDLKKSLNLK